MPTKVLLVGSGITSAVTGKLLQSKLENISITVWEKLNVSGGRFNTITGGKCNEFSADLGAQYITTTDETIKRYDEIYSSLFDNKVITVMNNRIKGMRRLSDDKKNYVAPSGMKSVVDHFFDQIRFDGICYGHKLVSLDSKCNKWSAATDSGVIEFFDIVVLTIPVPEILNLQGNMSFILNDNVIGKQLSSVKYSSRYALGLFFKDDVDTDCDSEYIDADPVLRYVATDCWKRNGSKFRSSVVHTTIQFGEKHIEDDLSTVKEIIMKRVADIFKHWPEPSDVSICQWKYSQVLHPYDSKPGAITLCEDPLLIAGGDGFLGSTFDQCLFSAKKICEIVLNKCSNRSL